MPARSCITYAVACDGARVTTIEGLDDDEIAIELRAAFTREHALQCGYCTPGMLISARDLVLRLDAAGRTPDPGRVERQSLPLHRLCRDRAGGQIGDRATARSVAWCLWPARGGPVSVRSGSGNQREVTSTRAEKRHRATPAAAQDQDGSDRRFPTSCPAQGRDASFHGRLIRRTGSSRCSAISQALPPACRASR